MNKQSGDPPKVGYFPEEQQPAQEPQKNRPPRAKINPLRLALLLVCAAVFVTCAVLLISYGVDLLRARQASEELRSAYYAASEETAAPTEAPAVSPGPQPTEVAENEVQALPPTEAPSATQPPQTAVRADLYPGNPSLHILDKFRDLRNRNKDIIGWLTIDGLVDEAVVQRDNSYYLGRDYLGYHNVNGALFLDENCQLRTPPRHMVIHGHNMKTGAMFGNLKQYKVKGAAFYKEHAFITFDTIYEEARYVVFAALDVSTDPADANYVNFIGAQTLADDAAFTAYVSRMKELSIYRTDVDVRPGDRLLTLATCSGTDSDERMLVVARKLRDGEDQLALNMTVYTTSDKLAK